ncbi:hypothetical protein ACEWY4_013325 [Coilia grayii]|uniref:G-protein coupled receptors family 1 profile domain-containing protein n=1 Tax=Coilia grayii TaxID=363190 RepID=A0ABD1JW08_9TELE
MMFTPTFCFIVSLAVVDFLVGAVAVALAVLVDGRVRTSFYGCLMPSCGFIPMFGWNRQDTLAEMEASNSTTITCTFLAVIPMTYMVNFNFFTCLLPPLVLMMVLYLCIFTRIHKQLRGSGASGSGSHTNYQKERKLAQFLLLVLVLFAVFYVGILLSQANSAINPVVYALQIQKIRAALQSTWRRAFLCKEEEKTQRSSQSPVQDSFSNQNNS